MRPRPDPIRLGPAPTRRRRAGETVVVLGLVLPLLAAGRVALRPRLLDVGSTRAEQTASMPADDTVVAPHTVMTRAVTLPAPPAEVWPWLVQMGVGRGGFYGYDWLENLGPAGLLDDIVNADRIHPGWQDLRVGDHVAPMPGSTDWTVSELTPNRLLVITDDRDWTWVLQLTALRADRTRLVTRMRWAPASEVGGAVGGLVFDLGDLVIQARALHGLRQRTAGTLPGMPGTKTGAPVPTARLPVGWVAALGWLVVLAAIGAAAGGLLAHRRGGWLVAMTVTVVLAWCLWTDTDPWRALGHRWPAAAGALAVSLALAVGVRRRRGRPPGPRRPGTSSRPAAPARPGRRTGWRFAVPALCLVGVAVVLPALTVWDAATAGGIVVGPAGRFLSVGLAATAATLTSLPAWWATGSRPGVPDWPRPAALGGRAGHRQRAGRGAAGRRRCRRPRRPRSRCRGSRPCAPSGHRVAPVRLSLRCTVQDPSFGARPERSHAPAMRDRPCEGKSWRIGQVRRTAPGTIRHTW